MTNGIRHRISETALMGKAVPLGVFHSYRSFCVRGIRSKTPGLWSHIPLRFRSLMLYSPLRYKVQQRTPSGQGSKLKNKGISINDILCQRPKPNQRVNVNPGKGASLTCPRQIKPDSLNISQRYGFWAVLHIAFVPLLSESLKTE